MKIEPNIYIYPNISSCTWEMRNISYQGGFIRRKNGGKSKDFEKC